MQAELVQVDVIETGSSPLPKIPTTLQSPSRLVPGPGTRHQKNQEISVDWSKLLREQDSGERTVTGMRFLHLAQEAPMVSIPKIVGVLSCGFVLCLGLSHVAQADNAIPTIDEMKADQTDRRQGGQEAGDKQMSDGLKGDQSKDGKLIKGEVLRIEGDNYFVKGQDGKEVRMHIDKTTQSIGSFKQGDRIEAKVNDEHHALSIRSARGTDAGNGKETGRDSLHETDANHGK